VKQCGAVPEGKTMKLKFIEMDHIVIRCKDVERQLTFYSEILGLEPYRVEEFRSGKVMFPSVRVNEGMIIDLFPRPNEEPVGDGPRNLDHYCLTIEATDLKRLAADLREHGVTVEGDAKLRSGARGDGYSIYVRDFEQNRIELRYYDR
jgi:catechol 2,3-dioxygenase-like lactoylglutathione lyase family enzyme